MDVLPFTLCADDYAESAEIDAGILQLLRQQRLGAVSCLVTSPRWPEAASALAAFAGRVDIGLHLNLTQAFPAAPAWPLPVLLLLAGLHCLPEAAIEREIARQIALFQRALGRLPDYIDGHQHIQQLPQVRDALLRQVAAHWRGGRPWIRLSRPRRWRGAKAALIGALGGTGLHRRLRAAGLLCNPDFAGVYSLSPEADYRGLMQAWLAGLAPGGVIMCHPAQAAGYDGLRAAAGWRVPAPSARAGGRGRESRLARARQQELAYLCSFDFEADCLAAGRLPVRFARRAAGSWQESGL